MNLHLSLGSSFNSFPSFPVFCLPSILYNFWYHLMHPLISFCLISLLNVSTHFKFQLFYFSVLTLALFIFTPCISLLRFSVSLPRLFDFICFNHGYNFSSAQAHFFFTTKMAALKILEDLFTLQVILLSMAVIVFLQVASPDCTRASSEPMPGKQSGRNR